MICFRRFYYSWVSTKAGFSHVLYGRQKLLGDGFNNGLFNFFFTVLRTCKVLKVEQKKLNNAVESTDLGNCHHSHTEKGIRLHKYWKLYNNA